MDEDGNLTLADGTVINTATGRPVNEPANDDSVVRLPGFVRVPTNTEAVEEVTRVRKRLSDLPDIPARMNVYGALAAYHLFGLADFEIAHALGVTVEQVGRMKMSDAFNDLIDAMQTNIVKKEEDGVRQLIAANSIGAVTRVVSSMNSHDEKVALVAAKDILDRAGHRPADIVEHRHKVEGGLTIEYVQKSKNGEDAMPVIDATVIEGN